MIRWNRASVKLKAKDFLRYEYWNAFATCLIFTLLSGFSGTIVDIFDLVFGIDNLIANVLGIIFTAVTFILLILVGFNLEVGLSRFFLDGFKGDTRINNMFSTFNSEEFFFIAKTQFLRGLYIALWSLLFIIPGIIKAYEYRMVPYILAEKPDLTANEVITKSRDMTFGHKIDIFVLELSFIGWTILAMIPCGLGLFFLNPYIFATYAKLYNVLSGNDYFENELFELENKDYDIVID